MPPGRLVPTLQRPPSSQNQLQMVGLAAGFDLASLLA